MLGPSINTKLPLIAFVIIIILSLSSLPQTPISHRCYSPWTSDRLRRNSARKRADMWVQSGRVYPCHVITDKLYHSQCRYHEECCSKLCLSFSYKCVSRPPQSEFTPVIVSGQNAGAQASPVEDVVNRFGDSNNSGTASGGGGAGAGGHQCAAAGGYVSAYSR